MAGLSMWQTCGNGCSGGYFTVTYFTGTGKYKAKRRKQKCAACSGRGKVRVR